MVQPKFKIKSMPSDLVYFSTSIWVLTKVIPVPGGTGGQSWALALSLNLSRYRADSESTVSNCSLREQRDIKNTGSVKVLRDFALSQVRGSMGGWCGGFRLHSQAKYRYYNYKVFSILEPTTTTTTSRFFLLLQTTTTRRLRMLTNSEQWLTASPACWTFWTLQDR